MSSEPSNDPAKSYLDTLEHDPFGLFAGMTPTSQSTSQCTPFPRILLSPKIFRGRTHEL
jgi:hypothetical protein